MCSRLRRYVIVLTMTMPMLVSPVGLAASSAFEAGGTASMAGAAAGAAPTVTAVLPPGGDAASAALAMAASARGAAADALLAELTATRGMYGATIASSGVAYTATDTINQAALAI